MASIWRAFTSSSERLRDTSTAKTIARVTQQGCRDVLRQLYKLSPVPVCSIEKPCVNGGRNPGHWGGAKAGQFELGGGRSRSALFDSAVASERPVGFGRVVEAQ